jgi:hypothetical protein
MSGTEEEVRETGSAFCKPVTVILYLVLKSHHEKFMEDDKLKQLFHTTTRIGRGFQQILTKFLPRTGPTVKP